ncbi:MAG TPA: tyrosine-type recombinase/integrase [Solirubrobacteraceae bacterium]|jgi:integrase|nr:tyrosine-type recombinase/integrase [Solirubrobacteraceae bacterium]
MSSASTPPGSAHRARRSAWTIRPLPDQVGEVLARLGQRDRFTSRNDLVFVNAIGGYVDPTTVRRRYVAARDRAAERDPDMPLLTFHGLRHTFGSRCAAAGIEVVTIQRWMGHASIRTTQRYMHHAPSGDDAIRISRAFSTSPAADERALEVSALPA